MDEKSCVFCEIVAGRKHSYTVFENDYTQVFLAASAIAEGHLLVIPKDHFVQLDQMDPEVVAHLAGCLPRLGQALMQVTSTSSYNVLQNNGSEAGQVVMHVHFHLIPRKASDGLGYRWPASSYPPGRGEEIAGRFQAALDLSTS